MDRVFRDANVLFAAAYSQENDLLRLWNLPGVALITSDYALREAQRHLQRTEQQARLQQLASAITVIQGPPVTRHLPSGIPLPPQDRPIGGL